jgi:hypothetical protein
MTGPARCRGATRSGWLPGNQEMMIELVMQDINTSPLPPSLPPSLTRSVTHSLTHPCLPTPPSSYPVEMSRHFHHNHPKVAPAAPCRRPPCTRTRS